MKTLVYCILSFVLGTLIAGILGYVLFLSNIQSSNIAEMVISSHSVDLLVQNNQKGLEVYHCKNLETSLFIFEDLQKFFLSSKTLLGTDEQTNKFIFKVKEQLSNENVCKV